jgi:hypothetical protein
MRQRGGPASFIEIDLPAVGEIACSRVVVKAKAEPGVGL